MASIHPTAIVHPSARVHPTAQVGPYCVVEAETVVGAGTTLRSHVVVGPFVEIGERNRVHSFAVLGGDPQDRKFRGERTLLAIGDHNEIREHATLHRGTANGGGITRVGSHNLLMVGSHVAHDCHVGDGVVLANQVMLAGHVRIEDGATLSGGVGVHHYTTVGTCAFVGGLARIARDVPPFMIVEGNPAEVRGPNRIGMERRGYGEADLDAIKEAYKRLFREIGRGAEQRGGDDQRSETSVAMSAKLAQLREEYPDSAPVRRLCDFLLASAEGVHGRSLENGRPDDKRALRIESQPKTGDPVEGRRPESK